MKKEILLTALIVAFSSSVAMAHCGSCGIGDAKSAEKMIEKSKKRLAKMTDKLGLSEEQASQIEALTQTKMEKKEAIKAEMHEKMDTVKNEYKEGVKSVLNEEQQAKFDEMQAKKGSMKGSGHDDHGKHKDGHKGSHKE